MHIYLSVHSRGLLCKSAGIISCPFGGSTDAGKRGFNLYVGPSRQQSCIKNLCPARPLDSKPSVPRVWGVHNAVVPGDTID